MYLYQCLQTQVSNPTVRNHNDVDQHIAGIIASYPFEFFFNGLHDANTDNKLAEEPELTITAYLEPIYLANSNSNLLVILTLSIV